MTYELESLRREFFRDQEMLRAAEASLILTFHNAYPPGSPIKWRTGTSKVYSGAVVCSCYGLRLEVVNFATGNNRFIYAYNVVP